MKKTSIIMKFVCATLILALGVTLLFVGLLGGAEFWATFDYVNYEKYIGDAYTGIQHAIADTAQNISSAIDAIENGMEQIYIFVGIFLIIMSVYLLACAFASIEPKKKIVTENIVLSQLSQYKTLLDTGIISQEEFDAKKKDLLGL